MHNESLAKTRAIENQMVVLLATTARNERAENTTAGHSLIVNGAGKVLQRAADREEILCHNIGMYKNFTCYFTLA